MDQTPIYIEWVDMPGGERSATDGPFAFVEFTYDHIRAQEPGDSDNDYVLGTRAAGGGWIRHGDESIGYGMGVGESAGVDASEGTPMAGWYSDVCISTVAPEAR